MGERSLFYRSMEKREIRHENSILSKDVSHLLHTIQVWSWNMRKTNNLFNTEKNDSTSEMFRLNTYNTCLDQKYWK